MSLVIVAIPPEDDYIWNISSEKVPHMTLLFLDENTSPIDTNHIVDFVQHASSMLSRFGMPVDYRGELGADKADVLFFEECKKISNFRGELLQDNVINQAYKSIEQFDKWTPHLTLGYPATPANEDTRDYPGTNWVNFDRIAVWTGDFEGPEFRLKNDSSMEVWMSSMQKSVLVDNLLAHHGVKGQKWGVRRKGRSHSEDAQRHNAAKKKHVSQLSDKELKDLVNRMNMEQQARRMNPSSIARGHKVAKGVVGVMGTVTAVAAFANSPVGKRIGKAISINPDLRGIGKTIGVAKG